MAETNTNFQTFNGNLSNYLNKSFSYGDLVGLNNQMGNPAGNQPTFINGGNIYQVKDNGNNTFGLQQIDTVGNRQQELAQQQYQSALGSAVGGLQTQKSNLAGQYSDLLKTVTGEYQPLINQTTASAGAEEARRGLSPDSLLNQQQVQGALQPVYGAEAANAQQIGAGSISDTNTLTQAISNMQAGGAGTASQLPLQYGQLALQQQALPSQLALNQAQAQQASSLANASQYLSTGVPGVLFNSGNGQANILGQSLSSSAIQNALRALGI